ERPDHRADVAWSHAHVAVSDDERVVLGVSDQIGEVADLEIRADRTAVGNKLQLEPGKLVTEALDDGHGGILKVPNAEEDFKTAIVLEAKAAEILVQLPVVAPQGLQDRHGRRGVRGRWPTSPVEHDGRKGCEPIDSGEDHQAEKGEVDHRRFHGSTLVRIAKHGRQRTSIRRQLIDASLARVGCSAGRWCGGAEHPQAFWPTCRQGASRESELGRGLYIGGAREEAAACGETWTNLGGNGWTRMRGVQRGPNSVSDGTATADAPTMNVTASS